MQSCDVTFDVIWRSAAGDQVLTSETHGFAPGGNVNVAVPYEFAGDVAAVASQPGDQLVWRFTVSNTSAPTCYIPNGDGANTMGRIPNITLPEPVAP